MNLNIKKKLYENVVPIICDDRKGTAFFISSDTLITARHNIVSHLEDENEPIFILANGRYVACTGQQIGNPGEKIDVAILKCKGNEYGQISGLKLLAANLTGDMNLHMMGYPNELGGSVDPIHLPLKFFESGEHSAADLILVNDSSVSFFSYAGFSGSPLVNLLGSVVGITIIEESHNLRAISIKRLSDILISKNIPFSTNGLEEDDSPVGLLRCKEFLDLAIKKAGRKYSPELHVPQTELENMFAKFMDFGVISECDKIEADITDWCSRFEKFAGISRSDESGAEKPFREYVEEICYGVKKEDLSKQEKEELQYIKDQYFYHDEISSRKYLSQKILFGLNGPAGTGKSHICHNVAEHYLSMGNHVYICHGTYFESDLPPEDNLKRIFNLNDENLLRINALASESGKYVLFVIDAINEGAGHGYWTDNIISVINLSRQYPMFKFLVSERRNTNSIIEKLRENHEYYSIVHSYPLNGFEDTDEAIEKYAQANKIEPEELNRFNLDLSNPLMLSMFCRGIGKRKIMPSIAGKDMTRYDVYADYLTQRNDIVSTHIDEDPHKNVTLRAVKKICQSTVLKPGFMTISRKKAMKICNRIVFRREWSKSLLHHLIDENILFEIGTWDEYEGQSLDFEFQNIGDVFRANALLSLKWSDEEIMKFIRELLNGRYIKFPNDNILNLIPAVIGMWNRKPLPISFLESMEDNMLEEAILYRGQSRTWIEELWKSKLPDMPVQIVFRNLWHLSTRFILDFHHYLCSLSMAERDVKTIEYFNRRFEIHGTSLNFGNVSNNYCDEAKYLFSLAWSTSSSHPHYRAMAIRHMTKILCRHNRLYRHLLRLFIKVNDPYVQSSVLCAIYGCLLITRDIDIARKAAKIIYDAFYSSADIIPSNLHVRQWSMLILEFAKSLDSSIDYYSKLTLPLTTSANPLESDFSQINPDAVFGNTKGGEMLRYNLFSDPVLSSDFNRYIIGTNNHIAHPEFFVAKAEDIPLADIEKMIAAEVIRLGWNDNLGKMETMRYSESRHDNPKERIGKKYLWIAYQNIMARLSDHCYFAEFWWPRERKPIKGAKPWLLDGRSLFDPTLLINDNTSIELPTIQFKSEIENIADLVDSSSFAKPILSGKDSDGNEWLQIDGWDNWRDIQDGYSGPSIHIQIVSWIVKGISRQDLESAIKTDIKWRELTMPYDGLYECLWNEMPWSCRSQEKQYEWERFLNTDGKYMPMRVTQLQEEMTGIEYKNQPISSAMCLNWELMKACNLYNSERGICRSLLDEHIVSYNRSLLEQGCEGLIVSKDSIDKYLGNNDGIMLTSIEYYKCNKTMSKREYEWLIYDKDSGFHGIARFEAK